MTTFETPFLKSDTPSAVPSLAKEARTLLEKTSQPSRKDEAWKFFKVSPLFDRSLTVAKATNAASISPIVECTNSVIVIRNGVVDLESSNLRDVPENVFVGSLTEAPTSVREAFETVEDSPFDDEYFGLVNRAIVQDVCCVHVPKETSVETPIELHYINDGDDSAIAPHAVLLVDAGSKATIVETMVGSGSYFSTPFTSARVAENARLNHVRVQRESVTAFHVARLFVDVAKYAHYDSVSVTYGAASARTDIHVQHSGADGFARIDGLVVIGEKQQADTHSTIDNQQPRCNSHQLHKCVVDDKAHAVFNGKIFVQQDAQNIDAYQLNRNLLLSPNAKVNTKPQLEIFADDVTCTHGATIGQLDEEQLFYLQSRGAKYEEARAMLTYAFAAEVIEHISIPSLRDDLEAEALRRTTKGAS